MDEIKFIITPDQAEKIVDHFGKSIEDVLQFEITEMLDTIIDELS